ncbi:eukaryotic translation initiation factor 5B-like [Papaver somniferum]|uniref:eukaryotic translation initiation factor 5B-like n=1 Tax=Papaver somniferum TaxID=3469 RepID=UPI000E6FE672|nr:eukaryotic translation initiation factor 5B-like [Papaver somniferum]
MVKGNKVVSKKNAPTVDDESSTEEENPSVAVEEIQKSTSPTTKSKSALKNLTPISSPTTSVASEEIRKSTGPKTRSKRGLEDSTSISKAEDKEEENSEKKKEKKRDVWFKSPESIFKIVNQFCHDNSGRNVFVFNTAEEKKFVEVESMPEDLFLIFELRIVASEPVEGECTKTRAEKRYGSLINRMKLKDQSRLGKLDVKNEILRIMKLKPTLDMEIERNVEDLYWFAEHNNIMTPSNEQGFPRFLRWVISDISNTIEKDINEAMKKMQLGWVKACSDEQQQIMEEYRKNRQENNRDTLKEKLYKALHQRDEALEAPSDLKVKHLKLVSFIEEKSKKLYEADPRNVQDDKDLVDFFVDSLQEIISFNKSLKSEDERDDDEQEEEEGGDIHDVDEEQDEEDGGVKGGDMHDDDEEQDEEVGGGKGGDMHDDDEEQDEKDGGGKGGDMHDDDDEGGKGGDDEGGKSENNEVPSETSEKQSTPLSKTNEEKDGKDETRQGIDSETAKKPSTSPPEAAAYQEDQDATQTAEIDEAMIIAVQAISQLDPKGMLPVEKDVLLLTQGEDE